MRPIPYNPNLKKLAKEMRNISTLSEILLWKCIQKKKVKGYTFLRQKPLLNYIVDFYCHELKLIIELDGWVHGEDEQRKHDATRELYLKKQGYHIIRYRNEQIKYEFNAVMDDIVSRITLLQRTKDPSHLPW